MTAHPQNAQFLPSRTSHPSRRRPRRDSPTTISPYSSRLRAPSTHYSDESHSFHSTSGTNISDNMKTNKDDPSNEDPFLPDFPRPVPKISSTSANTPLPKEGDRTRRSLIDTQTSPARSTTSTSNAVRDKVFVTIEKDEDLPGCSHARIKVKRTSMTKSGSVDLISISRREAIPKLLAIHNLGDQYAVLDDGPPFTIYVSDSCDTGSVTEGQTIREDLDFETMIAKLVHTRAHIDVYITFVLEEIAPFQKSKPRARRFNEIDDSAKSCLDPSTLPNRKKVHRPAGNSHPNRTSGSFVDDLKKKYVCHDHGDPGFCFVTPSGAHIRLYEILLSIWAEYLASGDGSIFDPPNVPEFRTVLAEPNCSPPHPSPPSSTVAAVVSPISERPEPVKRPTSQSLPSPITPCTPPSAKQKFVFNSPDINPNENLRRLLADFAQHTGIDVQSESHVLEFHALGPHSIPMRKAKTISNWTGITEDNVIRLQEFCYEWMDAVLRKRGLL